MPHELQHEDVEWYKLFNPVREIVYALKPIEMLPLLVKYQLWPASSASVADPSATLRAALDLVQRMRDGNGHLYRPYFVQISWHMRGNSCTIDLGGFNWHSVVRQVHMACHNNDKDCPSSQIFCLPLAVARAAIAARMVEERLGQSKHRMDVGLILDRKDPT